MIPIKGKTWRIVSDSPYKTEIVDTDMYLLGIFVDGVLSNYVSSGRPSTYRIYQSMDECKNGIRALKRNYKGELKPIKILTGEVIEKEDE